VVRPRMQFGVSGEPEQDRVLLGEFRSLCETDYAQTTAPEPLLHSGQSLTDQTMLCYNSLTGQGQLLWVGLACSPILWTGLASCAGCPLTSEFGSTGSKKGEAGESIEPEESH
jgi:hypothetical protein